MSSAASSGARMAKNLAYWSMALHYARERIRNAYRGASRPEPEAQGGNAQMLRAAMHVQEELQAVLDGNARMRQALQTFRERQAKLRADR